MTRPTSPGEPLRSRLYDGTVVTTPCVRHSSNYLANQASEHRRRVCDLLRANGIARLLPMPVEAAS